MPDHFDSAVRRVAGVMLAQYEREHDASGLTWRDFEDDAREVMNAGLPAAGDPPQRIRPGASNPENLYLDTGGDPKGQPPIGVMRTAGLAAWLCGIVNAAAEASAPGGSGEGSGSA